MADTTKAFEELKEQEPTWQESLEELRDLTEHQKAELDQHREHIENLMSAVERREKIIQEHAEETHQLLGSPFMIFDWAWVRVHSFAIFAGYLCSFVSLSPSHLHLHSLETG